MNISSMKTLLEIQAIQSIGNSSPQVNSLNGENSIFTQMLNTMMASPNLTSEAKNILGSFSSTESTTNNDYLAPFYKMDNTLPTSYYESLLDTNNYGAVVNNLNNIDFQANLGKLLEGANDFADIIKKAATTYGIPEKLIASVIKQESNFNPAAVSSAGATGLMQLMPGTARYLGVQDATNPEQNIMGGTKYLKQMLDKFDQNIELALAAYNAGPGNVSKYGGIPPFQETKNYVNKVLNYYHA